MNRSERNRMSMLDTALRVRQEDMARADRTALQRMQAAGFQFKTIAEAIDHQNRAREAARLESRLVAMRYEANERKAS